METLLLIALAIIVVLALLALLFYRLWQGAAARLAQVSFQKVSLSTKYGKMSEQFMPFLKDYPYDPQGFRFIGTPIDGVQFAEDKVVFVEFKTAEGRLSGSQQRLRDLISKKAVEWLEFRIK